MEVDLFMEPNASEVADSDRHQRDDPDHEESWTDWPERWHQPDLPNVLRDSLESNSFSSVQTDAVPMSIS